MYNTPKYTVRWAHANKMCNHCKISLSQTPYIPCFLLPPVHSGTTQVRAWRDWKLTFNQTEVVFTLNRTASALERKPYQIRLLFTHTCKDGDFGEKTRGREGARARGREGARARLCAAPISIKWRVTYGISVHTILDNVSCPHVWT